MEKRPKAPNLVNPRLLSKRRRKSMYPPFCACPFSFFLPLRPAYPQASLLCFCDLRGKATGRGWVLGRGVAGVTHHTEKKRNDLSKIRNVPVTPTPSIFSKVLPYKWGAYCRTNGGRIAYKWGAYCRVSLSSKLRSQESTAIQMGGVLPYKLEVYCHTFWTSCRGWGFRNIAQKRRTKRSV